MPLHPASHHPARSITVTSSGHWHGTVPSALARLATELAHPSHLARDTKTEGPKHRPAGTDAADATGNCRQGEMPRPMSESVRQVSCQVRLTRTHLAVSRVPLRVRVSVGPCAAPTVRLCASVTASSTRGPSSSFVTSRRRLRASAIWSLQTAPSGPSARTAGGRCCCPPTAASLGCTPCSRGPASAHVRL